MNARFWLGIGIVLGATGAQQELEAQIIDVHVHAFGFDEYGIPAPPNEITGAVPRFDSDDAAMQGAFDAMRRAGIVRAVTSGPLRHVSRRHAANAAIIGGAYTGPRDALPSVDELRDLFATRQIAVLGELGLQYRGVEPGAPELEEYWALAAELDVPVGIHTGLGDAGTPYGCCPEFRARLGNPMLLEDVLVRHGGLRVYLMHGGYPFLEETKAILTIYPQVNVDIAVINWAIPRAEFHEYLRGLIQAGFEDRIMFGSDQMVWPDAFELAVQGVESAAFLSAEQKRAIFNDNAARFLRLTPDQIAADRAAAR